MVEIKGVAKLNEDADVELLADQHRTIADEWIAAAMTGICEMHLDEIARRRIAARLF